MSLSSQNVVTILKAAAEPTRLRILMLLASSELNVKDLTRILGQSQPRISRHLKLLSEAGLIERTREGSWAYFQLVVAGPSGALARRVLDAVDLADTQLQRDLNRAEAVKREREAAAQSYFEDHAAHWDEIRSLHVTEGAVEAAMRKVAWPGPVPQSRRRRHRNRPRAPAVRRSLRARHRHRHQPHDARLRPRQAGGGRR